MKNIDDLLRSKAPQAETDTGSGAEVGETAPHMAITNEIASLEEARGKLAVISESLSMEKDAFTAIASKRDVAESKIESRVGELEQYGIRREDLLSNPEYAELEEVRDLNDATEEAQVLSSPSIGSTALQATLETLGIHVPADATEDEVHALIGERISSIEKDIFSKRLEIPEEREKIATELLNAHAVLTDANLNRLSAVRDLPPGYENGLVGSTIKEAYAHLEESLAHIPGVEEYPELKREMMERIARELVLRDEREKDADAKKPGGLPSAYEQYEISKANIGHYENQAKERGISLEELMEQDEAVRSHVLSNRAGVAKYEAKVFEPARQLGEYVRAKSDLEAATRLTSGERSSSLTAKFENLKAGLRKLIMLPDSTELQLEADSSLGSRSGSEVGFVIPSQLEYRESLYETIASEKKALESLENDLNTLGSRPSGLFSGGAQKRWDAEKADLASQIEAKKNLIQQTQRDAMAVEVRIGLGNLGEDVMEVLKQNPTTTAGDIEAILKDFASKKESQIHEVEKLEAGYEEKERRVMELEGAQLKMG